jgi:penicillin-binding protein 1C
MASVLRFVFCLPNQLFDEPVSMVLLDCNDELIGAHIADDGQWRFPPVDSVPEKFATCLIQFEDKRFYHHFGVDPFSMLRATWQNVSEMRVVSGGSTLSMQVIRLSRKGMSRRISEKLIEMVLATRLEIRYSKSEILALYASNAPFGGNVVGLEAASWRYFSRSPDMLSWAESAMLAVLPNSPSLIHLGKNRQVLFEKRNRLLLSLFQDNVIDSITYELAIEEDLPEHPNPYPLLAPHLLSRANSEIKNRLGKTKTSIDAELQKNVTDIASHHHRNLSSNQINNMGILVLDNSTGNVLAYVGNMGDRSAISDAAFVDMVTAKRSTGSILKPFLYAAMLSTGDIMPQELIPDIPTRIGGFAPENFDRGYSGAVPANEALVRSLNVSAVLMLKKYGVPRFKYFLQRLGFTSINRSADNYGLTLILGGAEASLWELCGVYSSMARCLIHFNEEQSRYYESDFRLPQYIAGEKQDLGKGKEDNFISAASIWFTFNTMINLERPREQARWELFSSRQPIAWKTGTSYGFRDAWSVGISPLYTVGVWVGNANGEGRPGIVGIKAAAPILFDVFRVLDDYDEWFQMPYDELMQMEVCVESGFPASSHCNHTDSVWVPASVKFYDQCPYHQTLHLDVSGNYRVNASCYPIANMQKVSWFVLPPAIEWYYSQTHPNYKKIPPLLPECNESDEIVMEVIYPKDMSGIFIPRGINGLRQKIVFEAAHRNPDAIIFWHIDGDYLGETQAKHIMPLNAALGQHKLTLVDSEGNEVIQWFNIVGFSK